MFGHNARRTLLTASKQPYICQSCLRRARQVSLTPAHSLPQSSARRLHTEPPKPPQDDTPFRKALKDAAKQEKRRKNTKSGSRPPNEAADARLDNWELTVGIEVHAELNTGRKLFSSAATSISDTPNSHAALFDVAFPGTQPHFQKETILPALRAAIAFDCHIPQKSSFDRKHYFYQDQPSGYQITQYYEPFAKDGWLTLYPHDFPADSAPSPDPIRIGIKQIQMEQDTAKTVQQPPSTHLLDFNRVSHPLIEIITLPHIHDPLVAAVVVRKIQTILKGIDACTTGMEMGGLRADVNVSVRRRDAPLSDANQSYHGVTGLGQRTEIKNLASVKAVEDAIIAERDRQIQILKDGGAIAGETRGWTLGSKTTKRLRGKEGEIDYRYMPDPDIPPVIIQQGLVEYLRSSLPHLPDHNVEELVNIYGLTYKDALTLLSLDNGDRYEYYLDAMQSSQNESSQAAPDFPDSEFGRLVGNWLLMELGGLFKDDIWDSKRVPAQNLASIVAYVRSKTITTRSGKQLLTMIFNGDVRKVDTIIQEENLRLVPLSQEEYDVLAQGLLDEKPDMVRDIVQKGQQKKIKWFVGQMMARSADGSVEPEMAEATLRALLEKQSAEK